MPFVQVAGFAIEKPFATVEEAEAWLKAPTPEGVSPVDAWIEERFLVGGGYLENIHDPERCEGRGCAIHHPSDHHMKQWPQNWRDDRYLMERMCPHGIGHPDPDDLAYKREAGLPDGDGVHGCDGCCAKP